MSFYIVHGQGWPSGSHGFNPQLVQLVGKFWVFLSHTAPWVSTVFFFFSPLPVGHPLGFAPEAILEDLGCPGEDQLWRCCSCLGLRGSGSTRYSGELVARAAGNSVLWKVMATSIGQDTPVFLPGEPLTDKPGRTQSTGAQRFGQDQNDPVCMDTFFGLWQLCPSES